MLETDISTISAVLAQGDEPVEHVGAGGCPQPHGRPAPRARPLPARQCVGHMHLFQRRASRVIARRRRHLRGPAAGLAAVAALALLPGTVAAQAPPPQSDARFVATELPDSAAGRQMA